MLAELADGAPPNEKSGFLSDTYTNSEPLLQNKYANLLA